MTNTDRGPSYGRECQQVEWSWEQTRELYTDWAAYWGDRSGIKQVLQWRGFPLWWASNLIHKDTLRDYGWYKELHDRLRGVSSTRVEPRPAAVVYFGLFKNMVKEIGKWLLLRLLPPGVHGGGANVWFHGLEYNLLSTTEGFCDRMYEQAYRDDQKFGYVSAFIIRLNFRRADFFHPWSWRSRITGLAGRLQRDVEILDRYSRLREIVEIHCSLMRSYARFRKFIRPLCTQGIRIGHAEFSDVLVLEMQKSFVSYIPFALTYAAMFERWLQEDEGEKTLVTYGETLAWMRPVYQATKRLSTNHRWISIQHATVYRNKLGFYHRASEFKRTKPEETGSVSPKPDFYFVHGPQFAEILAEFYPRERIRIIGCLKYDRLYRVYGGGRKMLPLPESERMLLLAPSTGDEEALLRAFVGMKSLPGWRVMLSKHPVVSQDSIVKIIRRNGIELAIDFNSSKSTIELIESASLVVCSSSGMALESHLLGVPSVRVLNPELPPLVEDEPGIEYVGTAQELLQVISSLVDGTNRLHMTPEISDTIDRYFFRFDGLASHRFWTELSQLPLNVNEKTTESG